MAKKQIKKAKPQKSVKKPDFVEVGVTGLRQQNGMIEDDFLQDLSGETGRKTYREMSDNDPIIGAFIFTVKQLIRSVDWYMDPASDSAQDKDAADFVDTCMSDMSTPWFSMISSALSIMIYGWAYHEVVYKQRLGRDQKDGSKRSKYDDGKIGWRKISLRSQMSLEKWDIDKNGSIGGMYQTDPTSGKTMFIPIEKAILFRTESDTDSPEGRSMLRNCYTTYYRKKNIEGFESVGIERTLTGYPIIRIPGSLLSRDADQNQKDTADEFKKIGVNIRQDDQTSIVIPSDRDDNGNLLYDISFIQTSGKFVPTTKIIEQKDTKMLQSLMADFIQLGHENSGSWSLSSDKTRLFGYALNGILSSIRDTIQKYAINPLLQINGMLYEDAPQLKFSDIEKPSITEIGEYVSSLAQSSVITPDDDLEGHLRSQAGLPEMSENGGRELVETGTDSVEKKKTISVAKAAPNVVEITGDLIDNIAVPHSKEFFKLFMELRNGHSVSGIASAISGKRYESLITNSFDAELSEKISKTLADGYVGGNEFEVKVLPGDVGDSIQFDLLSPRLQKVLKSKTASEVTLVSDESKKAIADSVKRGIDSGLNIKDVAKDVKRNIGLSAPDSLAVDNKQAKEFNRLIKSGLSESEANTKAADIASKYSEQLLEKRSLLIARTETFGAMNAGRNETWEQGIEQGLIPEDAEKVWIDTGDGKVRPSHKNLIKDRVPIKEKFVLGSGVKATSPGNADTADETIGCRCAMVIEGVI